MKTFIIILQIVFILSISYAQKNISRDVDDAVYLEKYKNKNFLNGKLNGSLLTYHENGFLKTKAIFKDGKPNGKAYTYYSSGSTFSAAEYKNGKRTGTSTLYYINGQTALITKHSVIGDKTTLFNKEGKKVHSDRETN